MNSVLGIIVAATKLHNSSFSRIINLISCIDWVIQKCPQAGLLKFQSNLITQKDLVVEFKHHT